MTVATSRARRARVPLFDGPLYEKLLLLAVVFMPFQYALTVNVGFPLKISEVLIAAALLSRLFSPGRRRRRFDVMSGAAALLAFALLLSALANVWDSNPRLDASMYSRGLVFDLVLYTGYAVLALLFWTTLRHIDREKIARAIVASIWLCGAATALQWAALLTQQTSLIASLGFRVFGVTGDVSSLRSGPFLEGQHLGFFAGASLLVALYQRKYFAGAIAVLCGFYSQSTTAYLGLTVALVLAMLFALKSRALLSLLGTLLVVAIAVLAIPPLRATIGRQLAKLGFTEFAPTYAYATTSLDQRTIKAKIIIDMFAEHPFFGVGPGRFGVYFFSYSAPYKLPRAYSTGATRPIAENAYGQIAAEIGTLGLIAFVVLILAFILRHRWKSPLLLGLAGFVAVGVATQSSWTFLPIWVFAALLAGDAAPDERDDGASSWRGKVDAGRPAAGQFSVRRTPVHVALGAHRD